jgi:NADH-quinone oxidoreductase subunit L
VIHAVHSNDMFEMGGLRKYMPKTYVTWMIGSLALAGFPPLAGFWSKDEIVAASFQTGHRFVFAAALITAFLTAFYMGRTCQLTFFGRYRRLPIAGGASDDGGHDAHGHGGLPHESPPSMTWPLIILAVLSVVGGWVGTPFKNLFAEWIHIEGSHHGEFVPWIAGVSIALAVVGFGAGMRLYSTSVVGFGVLDPLRKLGPIFRAAERRFFIDDFFVRGFVRPVQYQVSRFVYNVLDRKLIDATVNGAAGATVLVGKATRNVDERGVDGVVNGVGWLTDKLSFALRKVQTGNVQAYAAALFLGLIVLAAALFIRGGI